LGNRRPNHLKNARTNEEEIDVANYMILHYGFEKPTPEEWDGWNKWFESIADKQVDKGGLRDGREISRSETKDLAFGKDSITGYTIIEAEDLDEAVKIAQECPIVASTRVYEIRGG
jgi:hypothetical protein